MTCEADARGHENNNYFLTESILITLVTCQARAGKVDEAIKLFKQVLDVILKAKLDAILEAKK